MGKKLGWNWLLIRVWLPLNERDAIYPPLIDMPKKHSKACLTVPVPQVGIIDASQNRKQNRVVRFVNSRNSGPLFNKNRDARKYCNTANRISV